MDILSGQQASSSPTPQSHGPGAGIRPLWGHPVGPHSSQRLLEPVPQTPRGTSEITPKQSPTSRGSGPVSLGQVGPDTPAVL